MKKNIFSIIILFVISAFLFASCTIPDGLTSPSVHLPKGTSEGTNGLSHAADYESLYALIEKTRGHSSVNTRLYYMEKEATATQDSLASEAGSGARQDDYSKTNIQVAGVDEADIIKTDGRYLYLIANNRLYVIDTQGDQGLTIMSVTKINPKKETDENIVTETPLELYLDEENKRLVLIVGGNMFKKYEPSPQSEETSESSVGSSAGKETTGNAADQYLYPYPWAAARAYTTTRVYRMDQPEEPVLADQFTQDGSYLTSRLIGKTLYVVTQRYEYRLYAETIQDYKPEEILPSTCEVPGDDEWRALPVDSISVLPEGDIGNQTLLAAIDIENPSQEPDVLALLGTSGMVYASQQYLYIAAWCCTWAGKEQNVPNYSTDLYRFKLSGEKVEEAGKGSVPGTIINQFSMDEKDGYFRVATTTGDTWSGSENTAKNHLYILDGSLNIAGQLTGLAPGETIKSVRFIDDKAYVVTFRTVDPLFVIDLSNPKSPQLLGQLKIPGYSTYLHPYDENLLLGFGFDVLEKGEQAYPLGVKVSLFDISDFSDPKEVSSLVFGGAGSYSEIQYNHKALLFSKEKNLIAFPVMLTPIEKEPLSYLEPNFQGLLALGVGPDNQLYLKGSITHFDKLSDPSGPSAGLTEKEMQDFYSYDTIYRAVYIGETLYTFSNREVRATDLSNFKVIGKVGLPGFDEIIQVDLPVTYRID